MPKNILLPAALLATLLTTPALAETDSGTIAQSIVVTATRAETPIQRIGQSVSVIDRATLETRQTPAVVDLLRDVPSVRFSRTGGPGGVATVTIRGAESDQTVALIDGIKLNDPAAPGGGFNFGNLTTTNLDRIEVVRGSQSVLWGSQAIGGVINFITRAPTETPRLDAEAEAGWRDTGRLSGNVSGKAGPLSASLGGGWFTTDGISAFSEARGGKERDGFRTWTTNGRLNLALGDAISLDLRGWHANSRTRQDGFPPPDFTLADTLDQTRTRETVLYAGVNAALFDGRLQNRLGYALTSTKRLTDDGNGFTTFDGLGRNIRLDYQGSFTLTDTLRADFGVERETSRLRTSSFGGPAATARARLDSIYAQLSATPLPGLTLNAGLRHDDHDRFGGNTSVAANGALSLNDGATILRASYGEGFKAPSLFQLFSDFGNVRLQPETARSFDAGITQSLIDRTLTLSATAFQRDTKNQIDFIGCFANPSPICLNRPFGTYDNIRRSRATGLELALNATPTPALRLSAGYSLVNARNRDSGLILPRRARHSASASLDYRWPFGLDTGLTLAHVGSSFDNASNSRRLEGYTLVDLRASLPLTDQFALFARIENLFNERYETAFQYGTPGRAAYAGIRLRL
ncbi:TonB-dependent receptor plug domain-containing protein [Sandaracinobacteroides saxicola]|uniref:TonB-dependent receptor n=1 Tax=Sandaracinobacteroides saxicola TaxID=2759707 RepID=A0A7G5IKN8_9SPHN|nr:TonB-dependent receptor [Sandaracinobacteroides saxicola]QMW23930.1 TonB-dependent receptor [Sandaracinobacteroides saxicola]